MLKHLSTSLRRAAARKIFSLQPELGQNEALQGRRDIEEATRFLHRMGLDSHHDYQKNWDSLKALFHLFQSCAKHDPILDAGAGQRSAILRWLSDLGFCNLHACDRSLPMPSKLTNYYQPRGIEFLVQDIARTTYADASFAAVVSISVIEHGVHLESFLQEMGRILRPGGLLLVSTDYWPSGVDGTGVYPYGEEFGELKVFKEAEISELAELASNNGFSLLTPINLTANEKAVKWERIGKEYTFLFFAMRKGFTQKMAPKDRN